MAEAAPTTGARPVWVRSREGSARDLAADCRKALIAFWRDNCMGMAAMVAFFGFLSVVPLVLLLLAFVGSVFGQAVSPHEVQQLFHGAVPGLSEEQFLTTYWDPVRHSKVNTTVLGVVSLFFGSLGLHDAVDWSVNRVWRTHEARRFLISKLRGLAVILWVGVFAVLSLALTGVCALLLEAAHAPNGFATLVTALVPSLALDIAVFTMLYKLTPMTRVWWRTALAGAIVGATLWDASKAIFGWWVLQAGTYDRVYGPLAASVIVMLWLWISAMIFLFGATLAFMLQCRLAGRQPAPEQWWYDA